MPSEAADRVALLAEEVQALSAELDELRHRVGALETGAPVAAAPRATAPEAAPPEAGYHAGRDALGDLGLVGRTLMVLAGGFLLRAVTETAAVPDAAGVALGFVYALLWLGLAARAAAPRPSRSALFHAVAYTALAYPLLTEAVARFRVLDGAGAALGVAVATALGLAVAVRRGMRSVAWMVSLAAVAACWVLMAVAHAVALFALLLVVLGVTTLWLARRHGWRALPWVTAAAADLAVVLLLVRVLLDREPAGTAASVAVLFALLVAYLARFTFRSLRPGWRVFPFTLAQTAAVLALGYGGALRVAWVHPEAAAAVGGAGLLLAGCALAGATFLLRHRGDRRAALLYHSTVGYLLLLGGSGLLLADPWRSLAWIGLALVTGWMAHRETSVTLGLNSALFAAAAFVSCGLAAQAVWAFGAPAGTAWPPLTAIALAVLAVTAVALALPRPRESTFWGPVAALPSLALLVLVTAGGGGVLLAVLAPLVGAGPGPAADAGALAALRTALLAVLAVALAGAAHHRRWREAAGLVYPLLALGALKLLLEDFRVGRPTTLFVALALYGGALIAAPRLLRRRRSEGPASG